MAGRRAGYIVAEQSDAAGIGPQLAGDEVEECGLAGTVLTNDEATLTWGDSEVHRRGDAQTAERFVQVTHLERGHRPISRFSAGAAAPEPRVAIVHRHSRTQPGTNPSGMNTTIKTKIAPSTKFQRSM